MRHEPCAWGDPPEAAMGAGPLNLRRLGACLLATGLLAAAEPPVIPVGADAYLKWERWPYQRIGTRAYMRSTYDRSGGNEAADASHYLYQLRDDFNVTLDVAGPGVLYFVRYNHWHGSPWHYEVDGAEHLVEESNTADPAHERPGSVFLPEIAFPRPVAPTWAETRGADLSWVPIGFEQSFRMAYSRTHYGTGYYIFDQYVGGARLSQPISRWDPEAAPPAAPAAPFAFSSPNPPAARASRSRSRAGPPRRRPLPPLRGSLPARGPTSPRRPVRKRCGRTPARWTRPRSEEHTSELQSLRHLV